MNLQYIYDRLNWAESADLFLILFLTTALIAWTYIYLTGRVACFLLSRASNHPKEWSKYPHAVELNWFTGLWVSSTVTMAAGMLGIFRGPLLAAWAAAALLASWRFKLGVFPRLGAVTRWANKNRFAAASLAVMTIAFTLSLIGQMAGWFDGNFVVAAGHLARTGKYLPAFSDGQLGMVSITALLGFFFPKMSILNSMIAWGPLYVPFLYFGMRELIRELAPKAELEDLAILIFLFPLAFKAQEIRGSSSGFGLSLWSLVFVLRYFRTKGLLDLAGAVVSLASAWNFGQLAALYLFVLLGLWSVGLYLSGDREKARAAWLVLLWTNVIEWPHLALGFLWSMPDAGVWKIFVPGTASLALAYAVVRLLPRLSRVRARRLLLVIPFLAAVALAWWKNPAGAPTYNWYFFATKTWFGALNFTSYGLFGWIYLVALLVALPEAVRKKPRPLASALWLGFLIACIFQILAPFAIESGKRFLFDDRAYLWDVWKDTTLYWSNPFLVLACAYLLLRLASRRGSGRLSSGWVRGGTALAMIACTQSVTPYRALVSGNSKEPLWFRWVNASIAPDVDHPFRAQQSYSLGMYLARAIPNPWQLGLPNQLRNCSFCSLETYGFLQAEWPTIDFLQQAPLRPGEGFVTGDSVSTVEVYLNRQIRYRSGVNTINPIYVGYLDAATTHEIYWRNRMRIRRNQFGMAYTVADPERNLHWLDAKPGPGGSLEASVSVPSDGDYEIYFGSDWAPQAAQAALNGKPLQHEDSPSLGWEHLAKGQVYSLRVMPAAGQGALSPQTPLVLYPRRYWSYEKFVLEDHGVSGFGSTSIMRWAGVPSSPVTIEDMMALMTTESPVERHETLARDKIRYVVLDPILVAAFPGAASRLDRDPGLTKHQAGDTAIYELK